MSYRLAWDSQFWGFRVDDLPQPTFRSAATFVQHLSDRPLPHLLDKGWSYIDSRYYFERELTSLDGTPFISKYFCRLAYSQDAVFLKSIEFPMSRYVLDGSFEPERIQLLYNTWLMKSIEGDFDDICLCVLGGPAMIPVGYCTLRLREDNLATIGLIAVDPYYQGQRYAKCLLEHAARYAYYMGARKLGVVTQGQNIAAQKTYLSQGFRLKGVGFWYHKWQK
jgi:dTDP-4-amino-4,6-dideoxy-D-galactose acyltransferase